MFKSWRLQRASIGWAKGDGNRLRLVSKEGFTLIETVVVVTIVSLFSAILFKFYFQSNATQTRMIGNLQMQSSVVMGVNKILREVRTGTGFVFPALNENSPILIFSDYENNHKAIYPIENVAATALAGRKIYDLFIYETDSATINPLAPTFVPENLRTLCTDLEDITFRLNSANSVIINYKFFKGNKTFQVVSEGSLMNSGELR